MTDMTMMNPSPMDAETPSASSHAEVSADAAHEAPRVRRHRWRVSGILGGLVLVFWVLVAVFGPMLLSTDLRDGMGDVFSDISAAHWLGTDYLGRDMLARIIEGARITVGIAFAATVMASGLGTFLALLAATSGRMLDGVLSRALDTLTAIPSKMFALLMVAGFGNSVGMLVVTAGIIYIPGAFRIARSLAVNISALDYVTVARVRGEGKISIMLREILPNMAGPMLADLGLRFVYIVLLLAGLSFLGLGVQPPDADWGSLVRENIGALADGKAAVIAPSIAVASLTIAVNIFIDNLPGRAERERRSR
jgi:peptide/nickel transport system permease protein